MSGVRGFESFKAKLGSIADAADFEMAAANRDNALTMQRHVVPRIPVGTGATRDAFAAPEAVGLVDMPGGKKGWRFGLITDALRKKGYKAEWLEFGTKGYDVGGERAAGRKPDLGPQRIGKNGKPIGRPRKLTRQRFQRITRHIPARPARPFFRPGIEAARREFTERYRAALARAVALPGSARAAGAVLATHQYAADILGPSNTED